MYVCVCVFQINFVRQAEVAALVCPWKEPCFSWLKMYFYSLNVQVRVIFWQVKYLTVTIHESSSFFPPTSPSLVLLISVCSSYRSLIPVYHCLSLAGQHLLRASSLHLLWFFSHWMWSLALNLLSGLDLLNQGLLKSRYEYPLGDLGRWYHSGDWNPKALYQHVL